MRITLTLIALALVAALSAALVAPLFIDWSLHRAQVEAELSGVLGARVVVSGPIDIRFLPTPYVELAGVKVEDPESGATVLTCDNLRLEAALASLPSGKFRFTLARLDHPVMTLARGDAGTLHLPHWRLDAQPDRVALDRIVATGGELRVVGGQVPLDIAGLALDATAGSLLGPYRGTVELKSGGVRTELRFAAGALQKNALPLKLEVDAASGFSSGLFDGVVSLAPKGAGLALGYSGSASLAGAVVAAAGDPPSPWSVAGSLRGDLKGARLDNLVARFGPEERALEANGAAALQMGATPSVSMDLQAKQLNIDALLRKDGEDSVAPIRALDAFERVIEPLNAHGPPVALRVSFSTPTAIVGAQTLSNVALNANASPGSPLEGGLAADLPGDSSLRLNGALELGSAAQFKGRLSASVGDFAHLRDWAGKDAPALAQRLSLLEDVLPYRKATASGDVEISGVGFSARNLQLLIDRTALNGAMAFTRPLGAQRGRLFMDLRGDALDVDALPNLNASSALLGDVDLSLAIEAASLRVARVGEAGIDGGSFSLKMTKTGDDISLDRFSIAGLGGAAIDARGASGAQGRWLSLHLKADRLREFAAMVGRVAPSPLSRLLMQRADALSPAQATFEARGGVGGGLLDTMKAAGSAGPTQFTLKVDRAPGQGAGVVANFSLDAAEGASLLQQIGLAVPANPIGRAHVEASASGRWDTGLDGHASGSIAGANFTWRGRFKPDALGGDEPPLFGSATVKSDNGMALLAALGLASSSTAAIVPIDLAGDFVLRGAEVRLPRLAGTVAGAKITGRLDWRQPTPAPVSAAEADVALARSLAGEAPTSSATQIDGELALDHASLGALLSLPLGPQQPAKSGAKWSDAHFAAPLVDPPPLDVQVKIDSLDVADGISARGASAHLKMERGLLDLGDLSMDVAGGHASGRLTVRRDGAAATLSGQLSADLPGIDRPALHGRVGAALAFASTGQSPNALVSGLVGEGQVEISGLVVPRLDPGALARVLAKAQGPDARIDETNVAHDLGIEFDKQALSFPDGTTPIAMNGGVLHFGPLGQISKTGQSTASADLDLRSRQLTIHAAFTEADGGKFWTGPPPSVAVSVGGAVDAPVRQIDASTFAAGLAAQAIARESDRIASLEADIRERAAFNRRLKAERYMRQREAELEAFAAEQARIKSEQDRKRVEDELMRASEAQQQKAAAPVALSPPAQPPLPPDVGGAGASAGVPTPPTRPREGPADPTANGLY